MNKEKLYCYVDETGQDVASRLFVVVAVVSADEQGGLRQALTEIEEAAGTGRRKWHKSRPERRLCYLGLVLEKNVVPGGVFFGAYPKPLPYFFPFVEVIEPAIKMMGRKHYTARILIDGIDRQKARELTNALCLRDVCLETVKGRRDESEPLIRLADMWPGAFARWLWGRARRKNCSTGH
jgi:hypothetical protein